MVISWFTGFLIGNLLSRWFMYTCQPFWFFRGIYCVCCETAKLFWKYILECRVFSALCEFQECWWYSKWGGVQFQVWRVQLQLQVLCMRCLGSTKEVVDFLCAWNTHGFWKWAGVVIPQQIVCWQFVMWNGLNYRCIWFIVWIHNFIKRSIEFTWIAINIFPLVSWKQFSNFCIH